MRLFHTVLIGMIMILCSEGKMTDEMINKGIELFPEEQVMREFSPDQGSAAEAWTRLTALLKGRNFDPQQMRQDLWGICSETFDQLQQLALIV